MSFPPLALELAITTLYAPEIEFPAMPPMGRSSVSQLGQVSGSRRDGKGKWCL